MEVIFTPKASADLKDWKKSGNIGVQKKIEELLKSIRDTPFEGIGKPEPLRHEMSGKWSRRIDHTHRIVYSYENDVISIFLLRGHY